MTEAEWLACEDPQPMLQFLRSRADNRRLRLLACACARHQWSGLVENEFRRAVEIAELCADGLGGQKELRAAEEDMACASCRLAWPVFPDECLSRAVALAEAFADDAAVSADLDAAAKAAHALGLARGEVLSTMRRDQSGQRSRGGGFRAATCGPAGSLIPTVADTICPAYPVTASRDF